MKKLAAIFLVVCFVLVSHSVFADDVKFQDLANDLAKEVASKVKNNKVVFLGLSPVNPRRLDVFSGTVSNLFTSKLKDGKFSFPDEKKLAEIKSELGISRYSGFINAELAKEIAKNLASEIVITGRIMDLGENVYFNFQVFNGATGEISAVVEKEIEIDEKVSSLLEMEVEAPRFNLPEDFLSLKREVHFPYQILDFGIADIDDDGLNDFIALTPSFVRIFSLGVGFEEVMSFPYSVVEPDVRIKSREMIGNVFITDINRNERVEIATGGEVFEWDDVKFKKIIGLENRIVGTGDEKPPSSLFISSFLNGRNYYSGEAIKHLCINSTGELQTSDMSLPVDFYSLTIVGEEKRWCVLDNGGALSVFGLDKKKIWQSGDLFGNYFESIDFDDDGRSELAVASNEPITENSSDFIYILKLDEIGPILLWKSQKIEGSILKFHLGDIDNDKRMEFVAINQKGEKVYVQMYFVNYIF